MHFEFSPFIAVKVKDYENAVRFYSEVMSMHLFRQDEHEAELRCGPVTFYVEPGDDRSVFFEFKTDDLEAAAEALRQAGCRLEKSQTPEGDLSYFVYDPFGMVFHMWQSLLKI